MNSRSSGLLGSAAGAVVTGFEMKIQTVQDFYRWRPKKIFVRKLFLLVGVLMRSVLLKDGKL
jgi:hypothetical protein